MKKSLLIVLLILNIVLIYGCNNKENTNLNTTGENIEITSGSQQSNNEVIKENANLNTTGNNVEIVSGNLQIDQFSLFQDIYTELPQGWFEDKNYSTKENLENYDISQESLKSFVNSANKTLNIVSYLKYDPETSVGIKPTININLLKGQYNNFDEFTKHTISSYEKYDKIFENYKVIDEIKEIELGGKRAIYFKLSFDMKQKDSKVYNITSRSYLIPMKNYFYQINFSDIEGENNDKVFENFVKKIKFLDSELIINGDVESDK